MNVNSKNKTRDSGTKGGNRYFKMKRKDKINGFGAGRGRVICLQTCSPEAPVRRLHLSSFSFNYFLIKDIRNSSSCHFVTFLLLTDMRQVFHKPLVRCCVQLDTDCLWRSTVVLR